MKCLSCDSNRVAAYCSRCGNDFCDTCELQAENALLRELIMRAAPLAWIFNEPDGEYLESAHQWEKDAQAALKDKEGKDG